MIKRLSELLENVANNPKLKLAVAAAEDEDVLGALKQASMDNIVEPILIGDKKAIIEAPPKRGLRFCRCPLAISAGEKRRLG